jgi:transcriptional regulator with XRE-family HTH domain
VSDLQKALGVRIAKARRAKGLKQKHLAAALDVEPVTISRWETGSNGPPLARLGEIAAALDLSAAELIDGIEAEVAA